MSAFSAVQNNPEIFYTPNSSDEEESESEVITQLNSETVTPEPSVAPSQRLLKFPIRDPVCSNFQLQDGNMVQNADSISVMLKYPETLVIKGQYILKIESGSIIIDGVVYLKKGYLTPITAPTSHSLPVISCEVNQKAHFSLHNVNTRLEEVGTICPPFKNVLHNNLFGQLEEVPNSDSLDINFRKWTFCPVLNPAYDINEMSIPSQWLPIKNILQNTDREPRRVIIIGYKNSGKTSLMKYLLNSHLAQDTEETSVGILDVDPGQSELSIFNCVSYTKCSSPLIGSKLYPSALDHENSQNEYFGFNNPLENPEWYVSLIKKLFECDYMAGDYFQQVPLLVNMPGWVKGYGVQLIYRIIKIVNPTDIIYLKNLSGPEGRPEDLEADEILSMISEDKLLRSANITKMNGYTQNYGDYKVSSQELSIIRTLSYFHGQFGENGSPFFDFTPLLYKSPLKVSYMENADQVFHQTGTIAGVTVYNDEELALNRLSKHIVSTILDCSICAVFRVRTEIAGQFLSSAKRADGLPFFIEFSRFLTEFWSSEEQRELIPQFMGLAMIHSVNMEDKSFNLYFQNRKSLSSEYTYILARGKTPIPIWEMSPKNREEGKKKNKKLFRDENIPFISMDDKFGIGGKVPKVRRNIIRRRP